MWVIVLAGSGVIFYAILLLILFGFVVGLAYMVAGVYWSLLMAIAVLLAIVIYHLYCLYELAKWLKSSPTIDTLPVTMQRWQGVFGGLIEQHKKQEKYKYQLKAMIERYNRMINAIPSAVLMVDKNGKIQWHNALAKSYFNLSKSNKKQKLKRHLETFDGDVLESIKQGRELSGVKVWLDEKALLLSVIPVEAKASMVIAHDISMSERLHVSKNAFVANVSHELRTPLTVICGFLETMHETPDLDVALRQEFVALMQKESKRMLDLVADLLLLSRLENDEHYHQCFERVNLSALVMSVVQDAKTVGTSHQITTDIEPDVWALGSDKELYSAISNLVLNAVHHTKDGTSIQVVLTKQDEQVLLVVQDFGEGIAKHHLKHLTERFYRVDKGRSRKTGGSGLGLAITKHILARHHAVLTITSEVGVGSNFGVKIPCANPLN